MPEHTPKWSLGEIEYEPCGYRIQILDEEGYEIAQVFCDEGDEAAARLIAAAPEMLEALQDARGTIASILGHRPDWMDGRELISIDAAIAKATKES